MQRQLIKYLCESYTKEQHLYSELDQKVFFYLSENKKIFSKFIYHPKSTSQTPIDRLLLWRDLLKNVLLASFQETRTENQVELKKNWRALAKENSFKEFQIEQAYTKLCAFLLDIPYDDYPDPIQLESGFSPIEAGLHWPTLNTPLLEWHAELGTLWALIGRFLDEPKFLEAAEKIAQWQMKGLDSNYKPFKGFLSSHYLSHYADVLLWQGVLFHSVALARGHSEMAFLAKQQFSYLLNIEKEYLTEFSSTAVLLLDWLDKSFKEELTPTEPQLTPVIQDEGLALVGLRKPQLNVLVSLMGMNMGMGSCKYEDIEIPAFGPQQEILGEGKFFGIVGQNPLNPAHQDRYVVDSDQNDFNIRGVTGLPKINEDKNYYSTWHYPSDWMESNVFYEDNALHIHLTPYQVKSKLFFVFYVIANKCLVNGEEKILPYSLNQYQGNVAPVSLVGDQSLMILDSVNVQSQLKIIPLEGHKSFWGANYLIAYHLNNKYSTFKWKISMRDL